jgi:hypothetical protein
MSTERQAECCCIFFSSLYFSSSCCRCQWCCRQIRAWQSVNPQCSVHRHLLGPVLMPTCRHFVTGAENVWHHMSGQSAPPRPPPSPAIAQIAVSSAKLSSLISVDSVRAFCNEAHFQSFNVFYGCKNVCKKVKQYHYRLLGFQKVEGPRFWGSRHMKVVRLSALRFGHIYLKEIFLVLISVRGWVDPRATVRPKGLCKKCQWHHRESNLQPSG